MNNGRENRNHGNQEKGKEEKETLRSSVESQKGTLNASPKFLEQVAKVQRFQSFKVSKF